MYLAAVYTLTVGLKKEWQLQKVRVGVGSLTSNDLVYESLSCIQIVAPGRDEVSTLFARPPLYGKTSCTESLLHSLAALW